MSDVFVILCLFLSKTLGASLSLSLSPKGKKKRRLVLCEPVVLLLYEFLTHKARDWERQAPVVTCAQFLCFTKVAANK